MRENEEGAWRDLLNQVIPPRPLGLLTRMRIAIGYVLLVFGVLVFVGTFGLLVYGVFAALAAVFPYVIYGEPVNCERALAAFKGVAALGATSLFPIFWGDRLKTLNAAEQIYGDSRRPILYLRPFGTDERSAVMQLDTYEKDLVKVLAAIGPVIAVGKPNSFIGPPGASRVRLNPRGEDWKKDVD
jgi:hypothetical protein